MNLFELGAKLGRSGAFLTGVLLAAAIALADLMIQPEVSIGFLYVFPVLIVARWLSGYMVILVSLLLAGVDVSLSNLEWTARATRFVLTAAALSGTGLYARESMRTRQLLREGEEQLRVLFDTTPAAIIVCDEQGLILRRNEAAGRLLGDGQSGGSISQFLPELAGVSQGVHLQTSIESVLHPADGGAIPVEVSFSTYSTSSGRRLAAILVELGERDTREDEWRQVRALLLDVQARMERLGGERRELDRREEWLAGGAKVSFEPNEREMWIFRYLLEGASNKDIAGRLEISESTVKANLQQLFGKTGLRTRSQLVRYALENLRDRL